MSSSNQCCNVAGGPNAAARGPTVRLSRDVLPIRYHLQLDLPYHSTKGDRNKGAAATGATAAAGEGGNNQTAAAVASNNPLEGLAKTIDGVVEIFCTTRTRYVDANGNTADEAAAPLYSANNAINNDLLGTDAFAPSGATSFLLHSLGLNITSATLRETNARPADRSLAAAAASPSSSMRESPEGGGGGGGGADTSSNSGKHQHPSEASAFETVCESPLPADGPLAMTIALPEGVRYGSSSDNSVAATSTEGGEEGGIATTTDEQQPSPLSSSVSASAPPPIPIVVTPNPHNETITIATADDSPLPPNFSLLVAYTAPLSASAYDTLRAVFASDTENGNFLCTQLEPTLARALYPCFDEPSFKANFKLCLFVHPAFQAVSNTAVVNIHRIPKATAAGRYDPLLEEEEDSESDGDDDGESGSDDSDGEGGGDATNDATTDCCGASEGTTGTAGLSGIEGYGIGGGGSDAPAINGSLASGIGGGGGLILGDAGGLGLLGAGLSGLDSFGGGGLTLSLPGGCNADLNNLGGLPPLPSSSSSPTNPLALGATPPAPLLADSAAATASDLLPASQHSINSNKNNKNAAAASSKSRRKKGAANNEEAALVRATWRYRYTFAETPKLPPYLISFATGDFHVIETQTKRGLATRVILPKAANSASGLFAVDLLKKAVEFFEGFFGYELPITKIDIVAIKESRMLGMENWGMIVMSQAYTLVDEKTSVERRQRIARLIGHEVAHQWFGNIASIVWWDEVWLKEGFCRYLEFVFVHQTFPKWHIWGEFIAKIADEALHMDCDAAHTHPVLCADGATDDPRRIFDRFDTISYGKGASVLRMLASLVGDKTMALALSTLVRRHAFGNFSTMDFLECVTHHYGSAAVESGAGGADIVALVGQWITVANHPLLYVDMDPEGNYKVSQFDMCDLRTGLLPDLIAAGIVKSSTVAGNPPASSVPTSTPLSTIMASGGGTNSGTSGISFASALSPHRHGGANNGSSAAAAPANAFLFNPSELFKHSNFTIPIRAVTLVQGQTSSSRFFFVTNNVTNIQMGGAGGMTPTSSGAPNFLGAAAGGGAAEGSASPSEAVAPVLYFNFNGCGVFRCDFTTRLWDQIFAVAPYLTHADRLVITKSLFRFRTIHMGVSAPCPSIGLGGSPTDPLHQSNGGAADALASTTTPPPEGASESGDIAAAQQSGPAEDDRCTLLLKWLLSFSAGHPRQLNATTWAVIAADLCPIVYLLKGSACWDEFCQFVHHLFTPLIVDGLVSLTPHENAADFQATRSISAEVCFEVLHLLAITKYSAFDDEARAVFRWVLSSVATVSGLGAAAAGIEADIKTNAAEHKTPFDVTDPLHRMRARAALEFLFERGYTNEWWVMLSVCLQLMGIRWEDLGATPRSHVPTHTRLSSGGGGYGASASVAPLSGGLSSAASPSHLNSILDPLGDHPALTASDNSNAFLGAMGGNNSLNHFRVSHSNLTMAFTPPSDIVVEVDPALSLIPARSSSAATDGAAQPATSPPTAADDPAAAALSAAAAAAAAAQQKATRQAYVHLLMPAVLSFEDWSACPPIAALALKVTGMTTDMARAILRNANLLLEVLALGKRRISSKFLLSFCSLAAANSAHTELVAKLRETTAEALQASRYAAEAAGDAKKIAAADAMEKIFAEASEGMSHNIAWVEYVGPHYAAHFHSLRQLLRHSRTDSEIAAPSPAPAYLSAQAMAVSMQAAAAGAAGVGGANAVSGAIGGSSVIPAVPMPPLCASVAAPDDNNELEI